MREGAARLLCGNLDDALHRRLVGHLRAGGERARTHAGALRAGSSRPRCPWAAALIFSGGFDISGGELRAFAHRGNRQWTAKGLKRFQVHEVDGFIIGSVK